MSEARIDRAEVRARLGPDTPGWVADELVDVFEASAMASTVAARERKRRLRGEEASDQEAGE